MSTPDFSTPAFSTPAFSAPPYTAMIAAQKSQRSLRCLPFRQIGPNLCFRYHVTAKYSAASAGDNFRRHGYVAENGDYEYVAVFGDNLSPFSINQSINQSIVFGDIVASVDRPLDFWGDIM